MEPLYKNITNSYRQINKSKENTNRSSTKYNYEAAYLNDINETTKDTKQNRTNVILIFNSILSKIICRMEIMIPILKIK